MTLRHPKVPGYKQCVSKDTRLSRWAIVIQDGGPTLNVLQDCKKLRLLGTWTITRRRAVTSFCSTSFVVRRPSFWNVCTRTGIKEWKDIVVEFWLLRKPSYISTVINFVIYDKGPIRYFVTPKKSLVISSTWDQKLVNRRQSFSLHYPACPSS